MVGLVSSTPTSLPSSPRPLWAQQGDRPPGAGGGACRGRSERVGAERAGGGGPPQPRPGPTQAAVPGMGVLNFFFCWRICMWS